MSDNGERLYLQDEEHSLEDYEGCTWCFERIDDSDTEYVRGDLYVKLEAERDALAQKVTDAEILLFRLYDQSVMTYGGTRDAWEGFHGAAEHIRTILNKTRDSGEFGSQHLDKSQS